MASPLKAELNPIAAVAAGVQAVAGVVGGIAERRKAEKDRKVAQAEMDKRQASYEGMDFRQQNVYDDLTVSTQAQQLANEAQTQTAADTLGAMRGAAGGGGAAAMATAMARQSAKSAQQAAVTTATQEQANQKLQMGEQSRINKSVQDKELDRTSTLLSMSMDNVAQAEARKQAGTDMIMSGVSSAATTVASGIEDK